MVRKYAALFTILMIMALTVFGLAGCGGGATILNVTLNPVLDFYINRTLNTDNSTVPGYGTDGAGNYTTGTTGSTLGTTSPPSSYNYQNTFKLLYNFNISSLSGVTIQSASMRIYLASSSGTDATHAAILENIFYGNTDSFPAAPRNYSNEYGGYIITPAISGTADVTTTGWKSFDVAAKLQADINAGRTNSQFRLSHQNLADLLTYSCDWNMADNASNKPELVITYKQ